MKSSLDNVYIVEFCQNCRTHNWNTRHEEARYKNYAQEMADCISKTISGSVVYQNQIPKEWVDHEIYS